MDNLFDKGYVLFKDGSKEQIIYFEVLEFDHVTVRTRDNQYMYGKGLFFKYDIVRRKYIEVDNIDGFFIKEELING